MTLISTDLQSPNQLTSTSSTRSYSSKSAKPSYSSKSGKPSYSSKSAKPTIVFEVSERSEFMLAIHAQYLLLKTNYC